MMMRSVMKRWVMGHCSTVAADDVYRRERWKTANENPRDGRRVFLSGGTGRGSVTIDFERARLDLQVCKSDKGPNSAVCNNVWQVWCTSGN
jgi:hypothetical protein